PIHRARSLATWPADSRDVHPIPCHSHNDYLRPVPLFDALAAGCTGVEADVWVDSELQKDLYVGHTRKSLQRDRTLNALYIDPLLAILNAMNTPSNLSSSFPNARAANTTTVPAAAGVFETFPAQPITLLIDLKTPSQSTFPTVLAALQPLLLQNYLTTWTAERGLIPGPITVVGTGNTDFTSAILGRDNTAPRLIFFDAPLAALGALESEDENDYNTTNSFYASVSYATDIGKPLLGFMYPHQIMKFVVEEKPKIERG
ncbi:MAG: hypothetical protein LQ349_009072, partial [Xanthoria aureola]